MTYEEIITDCNRRMELANKITDANGDYELSRVMWIEAFHRKGAAIEAHLQEINMKYTNCGSTDLRLETCRN